MSTTGKIAWKNAVVATVTTIISYALAELLFSALFVHGIIKPPSRDGWYFEALGKTIQFDPVIGYRLTQQPARQLRISNGAVEFTGTFQGNNQGFPDRDDFTPARENEHTLRVAVIGDSFSSGQFLATNWPDKVEDLSRQHPDKPTLQLLNLSVYSGGLANWFNIVTKILDAQDYQLDALVFPVFANDLFRPFMLFEAREQKSLLIGQAGWDPATWPATQADAMPLLAPTDSHILSPEEWQRFLTTDWHPDLPRPWKPYMSEHLAFYIGAWYYQANVWLANPREQWAAWQAEKRMTTDAETAVHATTEAPAQDESLSRGHFSAQHLRLIQAIRDYARKRQLPVLVVRIPDVHEAQHGWPPAGNVMEFTEIMQAHFADGAEAFKQLPAIERRALYFPADGHWNQQGSDRFAHYIYPVLLDASQQWTRHTTTPPR